MTPFSNRRTFACMVVLLGGCATRPPVVAPPAPPTITAPAVMSASPPVKAPAAGYAWSEKLAASAQRLRSGLQGDKVAVSQTTDQRLWVSLPADGAFATGRSAVKAPATTWLDQVADAMRDLASAEVQIVIDADPSGNENSARMLALDRAASARDWLVMRGVPAQRISVAGRSSRAAAPADQRRLDIFVSERQRAAVDKAK